MVWTFFRLPEPKGRTYGELDVLFEKGISARKFGSTEVDVFETHMNEKETGIYGEDANGLDVGMFDCSMI